MEYQRKVSWVFFFSGILDFEILMVQTILEKKKHRKKGARKIFTSHDDTRG